MSKFCSYCGGKEITVDTHWFDTGTGRKVTKQVCNNPQCIDGCETHGGHFFPWYKILINAGCKQCGRLVDPY